MNETITCIVEDYKDDKKVNISLLKDSFKEDASHMTFTVCGGLNGQGRWDDYFRLLSAMTTEFMQHFSDVWVVELKNDCIDDIFYCTYGVRY